MNKLAQQLKAYYDSFPKLLCPRCKKEKPEYLFYKGDSVMVYCDPCRKQMGSEIFEKLFSKIEKES